jgi:hypothetical protein
VSEVAIEDRFDREGPAGELRGGDGLAVEHASRAASIPPAQLVPERLEHRRPLRRIDVAQRRRAVALAHMADAEREHELGVPEDIARSVGHGHELRSQSPRRIRCACDGGHHDGVTLPIQSSEIDLRELGEQLDGVVDAAELSESNRTDLHGTAPSERGATAEQVRHVG